MDLNGADLAKDLECPVCLDVFDEPKLLVCGHTVCQKCVKKVIAARQNEANAWQGRDRNCIKCPVCNTETEIPPEGLTTNYSLVGLVCRAQKHLEDACACNGCGKTAHVAKLYTCETCQEALTCKPLWICADCAMEEHRDHATSKCNKATRQQIEEACQGIASSGRLADMYAYRAISHLNGAVKKTELISELLNQQKRGFVRLEARVKSAANDLTQEDLAASQQAASELKQKFEQAWIFASEAGKGFENVLRDYRENLEDLFATEEDEQPKDAGDIGMPRNIFDLSRFDDGEEVIELSECRIGAMPDLSRFTELKFLSFRCNLLTSIKDNISHTTLTELNLRNNLITEIHGLDALVNLKILNIGCNRLRKVQGLTNLVKLKRIYLDHNIIYKIDGLETLVNLELLQLDDNRIKAIEGVENQHNLRELHLDKNRIRKIENISHFSRLRVLSIAGNRISKLENLDALEDLEEICVTGQGIETFDGIQNLNKLKWIDAAKNSIASLEHLDHLQQLAYLQLSDNKITLWFEVDKLAKLAKLRTVWLEGNSIQAQDRSNYRRKVIQALPQVTKVDATPCR